MDVAPGDGKLMVELATLRAQHVALGERVSRVETDVQDVRQSLEEKHTDLRGGQDAIIGSIHMIEMKFARAAGWAVGAGAVIALVVELIYHLIDHIWK
jgi:hypothetical protein